jgi:NADH dehydrogenase
MILITGATGFIGQVLTRQLLREGYQLRLLILPSTYTPRVPKNLPMDVVIASLTDVAGIRAALSGVDTVIHLVGGENRGSKTDLLRVDAESARVISQAARETGVKQFIYLSHLGADRASAYPVMKTKGLAESHIRASGVPYTILRSAAIFGPADHLTSGLRRLLKAIPFIFLLPGDGNSMLQPIWVEDLVACLISCIGNKDRMNRILEIGGDEYLSIAEITRQIQGQINTHQRLIFLHPAILRLGTVFLEHAFPKFPVSTFWLDYLAVDRTCAIDSLPIGFGIYPVRFSERISYLGEVTTPSLFKLFINRHGK